MGRLLTAQRITLWSGFLLLVLSGVLPLLVMLIKSLTVDGHLCFVNYQSLFATGQQWMLLKNSLLLSAATTCLVTIIGLPLGILLAKTDLPFRRTITVLLAIPLLIPPYVLAVSWSSLVGQNGILANLLGTQIGLMVSDWFFGLGGTTFVLTSTFLPIMVLLTMVSLRSMDQNLEQAGRLVSGWNGVLKRITLPLTLPGILLAAILVFLLALGEFDVPSYLRLNVYSVESFTQFSAFYNFGNATAAAAPLVLVALIVLGLERLLIGEPSRYLRPPAGIQPSLQISLRRWRIRVLIPVFILCILIVVLPLLYLIAQSQSLSVYIKAFRLCGASLVRSLLYATAGATGLTAIGFVLGYLINRRALKIWRAADALAFLLFVQPGTVIGIGLVSLWNTRLTGFIYATPIIILLGYLAQYSAISSRIMAANLVKIPPSVEEAARTVGSGWFRRITQIVLPLSRRGIIAAWLVGFIFCLRDTGLTMVVYPPGHDTLSVRTFTLMANNPSTLIAALCVIAVVATLIPLGMLGVLLKFKIRTI